VKPERPAEAAVLLGALGGALVAARLETAAACGLAAAAAAARAGARPPGGAWWRLVACGAAVSVLLNAYLVAGSALPWPVIAGRAASAEGLGHGALLALRLAGSAAALLGLAAAWPGERAADALARIAAPLGRVGVPVGEARAVAGLALRFAPLLREEAARIGRVQALRAGAAGGRAARARAALVPVVVGALERAERVALALEARHHRVRPLPPAGRVPAWAAAAGGALFGAALLWRGR